MKPVELRCEYLYNPIGIDVKKPRLFWRFDSKNDSWGMQQKAYQIHAAESLEELEVGQFIWDSRRIESDECTHIPFESEVKSREQIYWKVKIWDQKNQESDWSKIAYFEMGLLNTEDWKAKWIDPEKETNPANQYPASYLRTEFHIKEEIKQARLYITSCGLYEAWINGSRVGDQVFTPGCTNYDKMLQYQTYDITKLLSKGDNAIGAILGDGWFRGCLGNNALRNVYGERLLLLAQMEIELESGSTITVITDHNWKTTQDGPIRMNDLQDGEEYDANREMPEWSNTGFHDGTWNNVSEGNWDYDVLVGMNSVSIREKEEFSPKLLHTPDGNTVLDFGQNMAGYVAFSVSGKKGHKVTLIHGESLDQNGNFSMDNNNNSSKPKNHPLKQEIYYTLSGIGMERYKPHFTIHGFRYVLVKNWPEPLKPENFTAIAVYSDMKQTGHFECSNNLINQLVKNTLWSQKSNFLDAPTDCPQRERAGWTGDAQVFTRTGSTLMDAAAFYSKWMKDIALQQDASGMVMNVTPSIGTDKDKVLRTIEGSAGWGDAAVIIPWTIWKVYGDRRILEEQWNSMKAWVDYEAACAKKTHWSRIFKFNPYRKYTWDTKFHWGEWTEPVSRDYKGDNVMKNILFSVPEVATAYFAYSSRLLSECAVVLGKMEEAAKYQQLSEKVTKAYQYNFSKNGKIKSSRQCLYVRPLAFNLLPEAHRQQAADRLAKLVAERDYHIGTGFLSTPDICKVLCDYGHTDTAYQLVEQTGVPSWLYAVKKGATTIWENWDCINEDNVVKASSQNHYSYGAIVGWFFQYVAGIDMEQEAVGYKNFVIAPRPGGSLTKAKGIAESLYGEIESAWEKTQDSFTLKVKIPANTSAKIILPCNNSNNVRITKGMEYAGQPYMDKNNVCINVTSGSYEFVCPVA